MAFGNIEDIEKRLESLQNIIDAIGTLDESQIEEQGAKVQEIFDYMDAFDYSKFDRGEFARINKAIRGTIDSTRGKPKDKAPKVMKADTVAQKAPPSSTNPKPVDLNRDINSLLRSGLENIKSRITMQQLTNGQDQIIKKLDSDGWLLHSTEYWIHCDKLQSGKGEYKLKDEKGYSNEIYKIFVQPIPEHFDESVLGTAEALDTLITSGKITGAAFKFARVEEKFNVEGKEGVIGFFEGDFRTPSREKICIYTNSLEEMSAVVHALNKQFGSKAFEYGSESNMFAYDRTHGARFTYGISPLIHVRRGGEGNHERINAERRKNGEDISKPATDWSIPSETVQELMADASIYAPTSGAPGITDEIRQKVEELHNSQTIVDPSRGTVDLYLADKHLQIVKVEGWNAPYLLIDPDAVDFDAAKGLKGIREGEVIEVGRGAPATSNRFQFSEYVSKRHLIIEMHNGMMIIKDTSLNGTVVLYPDSQENLLAKEITTDGLLSQGTWEGLLKAFGLERANKLLDIWQSGGYTAEECEKRAKEAIEQKVEKEQEKQEEEEYGMGL